jgi:hypothetical protein
MAHITEEHLHHMAKRHHATMKKYDGMRERIFGAAGRFIGTIETSAGAWIGGVVEGRTSGGAIPGLNIPYNLGAGVVLLALGHIPTLRPGVGEQWSDHLNNLGNGFIGSYVAATGYAFGKRWKETKSLFGGGGHPWTHPYENGWSHPAAGPAVHGDLSEAQMASIVQRMQQAAAAP